jgi:hypothetical protein
MEKAAAFQDEVDLFVLLVAVDKRHTLSRRQFIKGRGFRGN